MTDLVIKRKGFWLFNFWYLLFSTFVGNKSKVRFDSVKTESKIKFNQTIQAYRDNIGLSQEECAYLMLYAFSHHQNLMERGRVKDLFTLHTQFKQWKTKWDLEISRMGMARAIVMSRPDGDELPPEVYAMLLEAF